MGYNGENDLKIKENLKHILNIDNYSNSEFKTLLGVIYAEIKLKKYDCMEKTLSKIKKEYNVDLTGEIDKKRTVYCRKNPEIKTIDEIKKL